MDPYIELQKIFGDSSDAEFSEPFIEQSTPLSNHAKRKQKAKLRLLTLKRNTKSKTNVVRSMNTHVADREFKYTDDETKSRNGNSFCKDDNNVNLREVNSFGKRNQLQPPRLVKDKARDKARDKDKDNDKDNFKLLVSNTPPPNESATEGKTAHKHLLGEPLPGFAFLTAGTFAKDLAQTSHIPRARKKLDPVDCIQFPLQKNPDSIVNRPKQHLQKFGKSQVQSEIESGDEGFLSLYEDDDDEEDSDKMDDDKESELYIPVPQFFGNMTGTLQSDDSLPNSQVQNTREKCSIKNLLNTETESVEPTNHHRLIKPIGTEIGTKIGLCSDPGGMWGPLSCTPNSDEFHFKFGSKKVDVQVKSSSCSSEKVVDQQRLSTTKGSIKDYNDYNSCDTNDNYDNCDNYILMLSPISLEGQVSSQKESHDRASVSNALLLMRGPQNSIIQTQQVPRKDPLDLLCYDKKLIQFKLVTPRKT